MENITRQDVKQSLFQGQKYHFEGYPDWYNEQLSKNEPIGIDKFRGNMQTAAFFYEKEANKLHFANAVLAAQLKAAQKEKDDLNQLIQNLEGEEKDSLEDKKKRVRRCASEIERKYICPVANCEKSYGTEGSVAQHMRLKHPQITYNIIDLTTIETKPNPKENSKKVKIEDEAHIREIKKH